MQLSDGITVIPVLNASLPVSQHIRSLCAGHTYDCIAVDLPASFATPVSQCVDQLPLISAAFASHKHDDTVYFIPADPCDAHIEAIRQAKQRRIAWECIGHPLQLESPACPKLPDTYALNHMGFDAFISLCLHVYGNPDTHSASHEAAAYIAHRLRVLQSRYSSVLALVHVRHFVSTITQFKKESSYNRRFSFPRTYAIRNYFIHPEHLYFVLGELPYITAVCEKQRSDPFVHQTDKVETIKKLFVETRSNRLNETTTAESLSPAYIQAALTFSRNLAVTGGQLTPSLFDMLQAAKGVGGDTYAYNLLKSAKYYPYLPYELDRHLVAVGINKVRFSDELPPVPAVNLLKDREVSWKKIDLSPQQDTPNNDEYAFNIFSSSMCSHVPEDRRVEHFNSQVRHRTRDILLAHNRKIEQFSVSLKDGIDLRETLRNWHTGRVYVREDIPGSLHIDTVVVIFDHEHDELYPHCATWSAEHAQESTLSFYATDPFDNVIGPGISRAYYGGFSLLYPPRAIPNVFELTNAYAGAGLAHRLVSGACVFSSCRNISYIAARKPDVAMKRIARRFNKRLVWIPISHYSKKTLRELRTFHVLNGRVVRNWASRYIGK